MESSTTRALIWTVVVLAVIVGVFYFAGDANAHYHEVERERLDRSLSIEEVIQVRIDAYCDRLVARYGTSRVPSICN